MIGKFAKWSRKSQRGQSGLELILLLPLLAALIFGLSHITINAAIESDSLIKARSETMRMAQAGGGPGMILPDQADIQLPTLEPNRYMTAKGPPGSIDWGTIFKNLAFSLVRAFVIDLDTMSWWSAFLAEGALTYLETGDFKGALIAGALAAVSTKQFSENLAKAMSTKRVAEATKQGKQYAEISNAVSAMFGGPIIDADLMGTMAGESAQLTTDSWQVATTQHAIQGGVGGADGGVEGVAQGAATGALSGYLSSKEFAAWMKSVTGGNVIYSAALKSAIYGTGYGMLTGNFDAEARQDILARATIAGVSAGVDKRFDNAMLSQTVSGATSVAVQALFDGELAPEDLFLGAAQGFFSGAVEEGSEALAKNREKRRQKKAEKKAAKDAEKAGSTNAGETQVASAQEQDGAAAGKGSDNPSKAETKSAAKKVGQRVATEAFYVAMDQMVGAVMMQAMGGGQTMTEGSLQTILVPGNYEKVAAELQRINQQQIRRYANYSKNVLGPQVARQKKISSYSGKPGVGQALKNVLQTSTEFALARQYYDASSKSSGPGRARAPEFSAKRSRKLDEPPEFMTDPAFDQAAWDRSLTAARRVVASPEVQQPINEFVEEAVDGGIAQAMVFLQSDHRQRRTLKMQKRHWAMRKRRSKA